MTRSHKYTIDPVTRRSLLSNEPAIKSVEFGDLYELSAPSKSSDVKAYINISNGKYYATWYSPDHAGMMPIKEVAAVWVQNVLMGNVSFIYPVQSGNDMSGESYNLGEFEALQRKLIWEGQKTTYWRKEAESRQRDIELLKSQLKYKKRDFAGLVICTLLMLISSVLIATLK